jgi:hypothetical protein
MFLGLVIPKVVEGKWTKDDLDALAKAEKDVDAVFATFRKPDPEDGLKAMADFEKQYPALHDIPYFVGPKLNLMLKAKKFDEVKAEAQKLIAKAVKQDDPTLLRSVSGVLRADRDQKELLKLSVEAAETGVKVAGDKDPIALLNAAQAHFAAGDKAKAKEYGQKAIAAADDDRMKTALERLVKEFDKEEEKKDEKKEEKKDK